MFNKKRGRGGIGRRATLRWLWEKSRAGSSPVARIMTREQEEIVAEALMTDEGRLKLREAMFPIDPVRIREIARELIADFRTKGLIK